MKNLTKVLALLLSLCLLMGMTACAGGDSPAPSTTAPVGTTASTGPVSDTVITTESESYSVIEGDTVALNAEFTTSAMGISLSYSSADESVATVSKYGKVKGISAGTTEITITSSDGATKTVTVTVEDKVFEQILRASLHVMFNDLELGCYNTETGASVEITGDGQYSVTFDCASDLSEASKTLGVTGLNNLTSIYIKDADVTAGTLRQSNVASCDIRWDKIVVDGVELTITAGDFKTAMRGDIFDTTDPINAWEGSSVAEIIWDETNHVVSFSMDNPGSITVTFTISNLVWNE